MGLPLFLAVLLNFPVVYYRLPNGLKVVVSESHSSPTVTVAVYYGVGFRVEPKGQTGFAHLFEHMMFQGSKNVKKFEHAKIVESAGGNLNGSTRLDYTNYYETLPAEAVEFFKTYYAPNNAVLVVTGDVDPDAVRKMVEKYFADIPLQSVPERPDVSEAKQSEEKRIRQTDKLASVPAFAFGYHIPDQESADYAPAVLLDLILQGDDSSRFYQRLVKEKEISLDWSGGINFELGNEFDYDGPMLMVSRTTYKPGHNGDEILKEVDAVIHDVQEHGVTKKELADAKVRFRSNYYNQLESSFGKAHLLSTFALFRDDPNLVNTALEPFERVTAAQVKTAAQKYLVPENRTIIDRVPAAKGTE
jgi:predicted Zn-dependent peptidase